MIIELNEMIDLIDDFYESDIKEMMVGGIVGTEINKFVIDGATKHTPFNKVLFIQGCQDYIGLMKKPVPNVVHWTDLFVEEVIPPLIPFDPWKPRCLQEQASYVNRLNESLLLKYESMVVFDTNLIPREITKLLSENFGGQIVWVIDPVEAGRLRMIAEDIPVIVDTLNKVSPIIAMARNIVGFESRSIDTKVRGSVLQTSKMSKRSIGKIDDKQYITNDYELYDEITKRQYDMPFRKNQKVIVRDTLIDMMNENGIRKASLGWGSMLVIENATAMPLMKLRLYNSKITYYADLQYVNKVPHQLTRRGKINVFPANIITLNHVGYHRYNHSVLVLTDDIQPEHQYSVLKNSNNVTVIDKRK